MPPEGDRLCPRCGQLIPAGQTACPVCTRPKGFLWSLERETLVLVSIVLLAVFFVVVAFITKRYHTEQRDLGRQWYERGEVALRANDPRKAVDNFHTALVYAKETAAFPVYQMSLAEALVEANRLGEAQVQLQALWEQEPGSGKVNLEMARLFAKSHNVSEAIRYYHSAVFGAWESNPEIHRRNARIELCRFLLKENERNAAESELIALQAELPAKADLHIKVGNMFMQVEDFRRALEEFQQALKLNPKQLGAPAGAGEAAYQLAEYAQARRYFQKAVELNPKNKEAVRKLEVSRLVLESDPFQRRLSQEERGRRTIAAFQQALSRLKQCAQSRGVNLKTQPAAGPFANVYSNVIKMQPKVHRRNLRRDPDLITNVMDLVKQIEETAQQSCGTPPAPDQALLMISQSRGATER
jgi:tetratricopeptide (TPR) repeat protein